MSLPEKPTGREETYLASIAGQNVQIPDNPQGRVEEYLDYIARTGGGGGGGAFWGSIAGTLADQTDLQTALSARPTTNDMVAYVNNAVLGGAD